MSIAAYIDHTLLKQDAAAPQIDRLCAEAAQYHFASVCVNPWYVPRCVKHLQGTGVEVCTVVGFPLGATTTESKVFETLQAVKSGAEEIDMVMNVCAMKSGNTRAIEQEIQALAAAVQNGADAVYMGLAGSRPRCRPPRRGRLCQDLHRLFHRRRNRGRCGPDAQDRRPGDGREGGRRHPGLCHGKGHAGRRRHPDRRFRRHRHRAAGAGSSGQITKKGAPKGASSGGEVLCRICGDKDMNGAGRYPSA